MKKGRKFLSTVMAVLMTSSVISSMPISAYTETKNEISQFEELSLENNFGYTFTAETGDLFEGATLLSQETNTISATKTETVRTFLMPDGTTCSDSMIVEQRNNSVGRSKSGSANNVTYTAELGLAYVSINASFDWYTSGSTGYVRCSNMTAYYSAKTTQIACSRFNKSKSSGYVKSGKAYAQVSYYFYNKKVPTAANSGTFKVTCSDTGKISS